MELAELIELAQIRAGNHAKLAEQIGVPFQHVSNWKNGKRTCTPEDRALLAHAAGLDPTPFLVDAMVEKHEGTKKGEVLKRALGKLKRGAGVTLSYGVAGAALIAAVSDRLATMYRERNGVGGKTRNEAYVNLKSPKPQARAESRAQQPRRTHRPSERAK